MFEIIFFIELKDNCGPKCRPSLIILGKMPLFYPDLLGNISRCSYQLGPGYAHLKPLCKFQIERDLWNPLLFPSISIEQCGTMIIIHLGVIFPFKNSVLLKKDLVHRENIWRKINILGCRSFSFFLFKKYIEWILPFSKNSSEEI